MPIVVSCTAEKRSNKLSKSALSSAFKNCRGNTFGKAVWSDDTDEGDDEDEEDVVPEEPDEVVLARLAEEARQALETRKKELSVEFLRVLKAWRGLALGIDYTTYFPDLPKVNVLDLIEDLMFVDMGIVYSNIVKSDPQREKYGWLPVMAGCSVGQIGALMAESFCERVISKSYFDS